MIDWLACFIVKGLGRLLCLLPPGWVVKLGEGAGLLVYFVQPKRARIGWDNLRAAYQGQLDERETKKILKGCFATVGAGIFELLRLPVIDAPYVEQYLDIRNRETFERIMRGERPVIMLTGHFGNWELASIAAGIAGHPMFVLAREQNRMPRLYHYLISLRESKGCRVIHKGGALRKLLTALDSGQLVGIVGDQASRQGKFYRFFGRRALFSTGPFQMAYAKNAYVMPTFIHRTRGAYQAIHLEDPIDLSLYATEEEAVDAGVSAFVRILTRHIQASPAHWLWMHKRWKHTPERRVLVLSDAKAGHVKQSKAVAKILAETPGVSAHVQKIEVRNRLCRGLLTVAALIPGTLLARRVLRWALKPDSSRQLFKQYGDVVISCGSLTNAVNAIWSAPFGHRMITLMHPRPVPKRALDIVIAPVHDRVSKLKKPPILIRGALTAGDPQSYQKAGERLKRHPRFKEGKTRYLALCLGGDTRDYQLTLQSVQQSVEALLARCRDTGAHLLVTTSRRTPSGIEAWLKQRFENEAACALLVLVSEDAAPLVIEGMFGLAEGIVVTGESISMVTEACAAGKPVWVTMPDVRPKRKPSAKHERFLNDLEAEGYIRRVLPETLASALDQPFQPANPLDNAAVVREALKGVL